jgi:hypothetical protein
MDTSGDGQPEAYESYIGGVSEPPPAHGWDSSLDGNALAVTCSPYQEEEYALSEPVLVVEILSPSNQAET